MAVFSFLERIVGKPESKPGKVELPYVIGLKFLTHSRAEQNELECVERAIRDAGFTDIVIDKIENGLNDVAFWLHAANGKRAFKQLSELHVIAERMTTLQAAYADRTTLKFSPLWPKGGKPHVPRGLG